MSSNRSEKINVAGHRGMVGSAIVRALKKQGENNILTRTHAELDLTHQALVQQFFEQERPTQVYLAAAKVGGIHANNTYIDFMLHWHCCFSLRHVCIFNDFVSR